MHFACFRCAALRRYTETTVSVRRGGTVLIYDERGRQVGIVPGR